MCSYGIGVIIKVSIFPKPVEDHAQKNRNKWKAFFEVSMKSMVEN